MVEVVDLVEELRKYVHGTNGLVTDSNEMLSLRQSAVQCSVSTVVVYVWKHISNRYYRCQSGI